MTANKVFLDNPDRPLLPRHVQVSAIFMRTQGRPRPTGHPLTQQLYLWVCLLNCQQLIPESLCHNRGARRRCMDCAHTTLHRLPH
ncbi:hypothetical protein T05_14563 [Trichinella murrelli]|uniref:Uncharacterized protein n=1 Tax=Trichinella murrelli TaxID=144512 RepID=A0A0V0T3N2_9BILA|nr:hypothetical protein T05_14563 [Trichinella murrelli]